MKTVGIIIREFKKDDIDYIGTRKDLFAAISEFNVNIIGIPIYISFDKITETVNLCDGIILSGGSEILDNDFLLVDYLHKNNIPTLGICLGMQSMAEHFNNHIEEKIIGHDSKNEYVHNININKESILYRILKQDNIKVNSRHNYCVPSTNLDIVAYSDDNIIEAVEDKTKKFFIGVQWHPESINDNNSYQLFKAFIDSMTN